jgi:uncharacterized protein (TIGR02145 family)
MGELTYTISGTPSGSGVAIFALNIGGKTCTMTLAVSAGAIDVLNCSSATVSGSLASGQAASNVSVTVPYAGGNGGTHSGQSVTSTGVTGLTATLSSGSFLSGSGSLSYSITGTPSSSGTASFALNIGGQTCTLSVTVQVPVGTISSLNCSSATVSGSLTSGQAASNVSVTVPYAGGNGGTHSGQSVTSTGVTGLTATLSSGSFLSGSGNLTYFISGTPSGSGTASFALNIGGKTCTLSVSVQVPVGTISSLNCSSATVSGSLTSGQAASNVSVTVPYAGGNGGTHSGQTVTSTGVTDLTATLSSGSFASGSGTLSYGITGTPSGSGTASFALNIGGKTCTLSITVLGQCNAKISATETKTFMCHNLGAANTSADPFTPGWQINGGYWQWGRSVQAAAGPSGSGSSQANEGSISGWNTTGAADGSWIDNTKTSNDPCPSGFRVPTKAQWDGVIANNTLTNVGTNWTESTTNYSTGKMFGNNLFLPAAGLRINGVSSLFSRGSDGYYWSSTEGGTNVAWHPSFNINGAGTSNNGRATGMSVRCIAE